MTDHSIQSAEPNKSAYNRFLLLVSGMGGLLYGIDIGIIDPALGYLGKTISMTGENKSVIVAAVLGGSMFASVITGFFADLLGRKLISGVSLGSVPNNRQLAASLQIEVGGFRLLASNSIKGIVDTPDLTFKIYSGA